MKFYRFKSINNLKIYTNNLKIVYRKILNKISFFYPLLSIFIYKWTLPALTVKVIILLNFILNYNFIIIPLILIIIYPIVVRRIYKWTYASINYYFEDIVHKIDLPIYACYAGYIIYSLVFLGIGYIRHNIITIASNFNFIRIVFILSVIIFILFLIKDKIKNKIDTIKTNYKKSPSLYISSKLSFWLCLKYIFIVNLLVYTNISYGNWYENIIDLSVFCILFDDMNFRLKNWAESFVIRADSFEYDDLNPATKKHIFDFIARHSDMSSDFISKNFDWSGNNLWLAIDFLNIFPNKGIYVIAHDLRTGMSLAIPVNNAKYCLRNNVDSHIIHTFQLIGREAVKANLYLNLRLSNINNVYLYGESLDIYKLAGPWKSPTSNKLVYCENKSTKKFFPYDPLVKNHGKKGLVLKDIHGNPHHLDLQSLSPSGGIHKSYLGQSHRLNLIKTEQNKQLISRTVAKNKGMNPINTVHIPGNAGRPRIPRFKE